MSSHALRLRLHVAFNRVKLDTALVHGADPSSDAALGLRADQLTALPKRRGITNTIEDILDAADGPPDTWVRAGPRPPLQRDDVLAARHQLRVLAARLRDPGYVPPRALALAAILVWDSASPIYAPGAGTTVSQLADTVLKVMSEPDQRPVGSSRPPALGNT